MNPPLRRSSSPRTRLIRSFRSKTQTSFRWDSQRRFVCFVLPPLSPLRVVPPKPPHVVLFFSPPVLQVLSRFQPSGCLQATEARFVSQVPSSCLPSLLLFLSRFPPPPCAYTKTSITSTSFWSRPPLFCAFLLAYPPLELLQLRSPGNSECSARIFLPCRMSRPFIA